MMPVLTRNALIAATRPNWSRPVGVEYTFKTRVFTARDGTEQREALRQTARVALKFSSILSRAGLIRHFGDMATAQEGPLAVRAEWKRAALAAPMLSGATTFTLDAAPGWLAAGDVVILTTDTIEDLFDVAAVAGATITTNQPAVRDYAAGTRVNLAYWTRPTAKVDFKAETDTIWQGNLRYEVVPGTTRERYRWDSAPMFEGREVFLTAPNWRTRPRIAFVQSREDFDPGMGQTVTGAPELGDHLRVQLGYSAFNTAAADDLIGFFLRHKGRRGAFWMPTWSRDIQPSATVLGPANQFQIDGLDFDAAYSGHPVFAVMIAFWPDGTHQVNRLNQIIKNTDSVLDFQDAWVNPIAPTTEIMWLPLWRFDSDTLEVRWLTDSVAEMQFALKTTFETGYGKFADPAVSAPLGLVMPAASGDLTMRVTPSTAIGDVADLLALGFSAYEVDAGEARVAAAWSGTSTDPSTSVQLEIFFYEAAPVHTYDAKVAPVAGDVVLVGGAQAGSLSAQLGPVTVPPTARFVEFRAGYDTPGTTVFTLNRWAAGRAAGMKGP